MLLVIGWKFGRGVCLTYLSIDYTASTASIFNLFILSLDRWVGIIELVSVFLHNTVFSISLCFQYFQNPIKFYLFGCSFSIHNNFDWEEAKWTAFVSELFISFFFYYRYDSRILHFFLEKLNTIVIDQSVTETIPTISASFVNI